MRLNSKTEPYTFTSLGTQDRYGDPMYTESSLFPIGSIVELTDGLFPFRPSVNGDVARAVGFGPHIIGGKSVRIIAFTYGCGDREFSSWHGGAEFTVIEWTEEQEELTQEEQAALLNLEKSLAASPELQHEQK